VDQSHGGCGMAEHQCDGSESWRRGGATDQSAVDAEAQWVRAASTRRNGGSEPRQCGGMTCQKRRRFGGVLALARWISPFVSRYWVGFDKWQTRRAVRFLRAWVLAS
jgi:hypothetical protein